MARVENVHSRYAVEGEYAGHRASVVTARIVNLVGGVIISLLSLRFILFLLGANPSNGFANFIYTTSRPFVAPFFGLFNYKPEFGVARFEFETLIAIVIYALLTVLLTRLLTINRRLDDY